MTHSIGDDIDVRNSVAVGHHGEVELSGVGERPTPSAMFPVSGTIGKISRSGAPARWSGVGGPGTLATYTLAHL